MSLQQKTSAQIETEQIQLGAHRAVSTSTDY